MVEAPSLAIDLPLKALVAEDAEVLGCRREIEHIRTILSRGTSAHRH